jgi:hypothetical protein
MEETEVKRKDGSRVGLGDRERDREREKEKSILSEESAFSPLAN